MGITVFQHKVEIIKPRKTTILLVLCFLGAGATLGLPHTLAGLAALYVITVSNVKNAVFNFLGDVSYSLYLLHAIIGGSVISLGVRSGFAANGAGQAFTLFCWRRLPLRLLPPIFCMYVWPAQVWSASFTHKSAVRNSSEKGDLREFDSSHDQKQLVAASDHL